MHLLNDKRKIIFFSKNDIYVLDLSGSSVYLAFGYDNDSNETKLSLTTNSSTRYKLWKLTDFDHITTFLNSISNDKDYETVWGRMLTVSSKHSENKFNTSYDYLDSDNYDYLVPYWKHTNNSTIISTGSCNGGLCPDLLLSNKPYINGVGGFNVPVGMAYDLYGYNLGSLRQIKKIFSVDIQVAPEDLSKYLVNLSFNTLSETHLDKVQVFGRITKDNVYYWEDITYKTGKTNYYVPGYSFEKYTNYKYSIKLHFDHGQNLEKYDMFYIKYYFHNGASNVYNISYDGDKMGLVFFNDISQFGIFDNINTTISMKKAHIFTTRSSLYNEHFYYLDDTELISDDFRTSYNLFDTKNLSILETDKSNTRLYSSYNGHFSKVNAGTFGTSKNIGLYTYLRNISVTNTSYFNGSVNMKYYYVPVDPTTLEPILYVSTGIIDDSRLSMSFNYVDENGDIISGTIYDEFEEVLDTNFLTRFFNNFLKIFIPTDSQLNGAIKNLKINLSKKLGGVWQLLEIPINIFNNLLDNKETNSCITFPSLTEPFSGITFYSGDTLCFIEFREKLPQLFTITDLIISIIATLSLGTVYYHKIKRLVGGGS